MKVRATVKWYVMYMYPSQARPYTDSIICLLLSNVGTSEQSACLSHPSLPYDRVFVGQKTVITPQPFQLQQPWALLLIRDVR